MWDFSFVLYINKRSTLVVLYLWCYLSEYFSIALASVLKLELVIVVIFKNVLQRTSHFHMRYFNFTCSFSLTLCVWLNDVHLIISLGKLSYHNICCSFRICLDVRYIIFNMRGHANYVKNYLGLGWMFSYILITNLEEAIQSTKWVLV